ncbi:MAG TPA: glycosyltransferase, partial [Chroococcales cyanobacterium]
MNQRRNPAVTPEQCPDTDILVSAIVSTYGAEKFIRECLNNLVQQDLFLQERMEIIVIDACSPEDEGSIVKEFQAKHPNISYERTSQRETIYASWNRAIRASRGRFVINANTDDRFVPAAFARLARELSEDSSIQAVYGDWMVTKTENDRFGSETDKFVFHYPEFYPPLLLYYQITSHSLMIRREVFDSIGYYDEDYKVFGDRDLMLRFACAGLKAKKIPHLVGLYLDSPESLGHAEPARRAEWNDLFGRYLQPSLFSKLFGLPELSEPKQFAQLYAILGSMGDSFNFWGALKMSNYGMAKRYFEEALLFDPDNLLALNDLGVILCLCGEHRQGVELFRRALPNAQDSSFVEENLRAGERGSLEFGDFNWIKVQPPRSTGMHEERYLVSAIVSTYNSETFIRGCLEDLEAQTMADKLEIIVVDSGSSQNERAIVVEFQQRYSNIKYLRTEQRESVYQAWNRGVKAAAGKYLTNANTDDRHRSDAFEVMATYLEEHPEVPLVYSNQLATDEPNKPYGEAHVIGQLTKTIYHRNIMLTGCFMGSQPMWRKSIHDELGYFDERFRSAGDYELWCRIAQEHELAFIPQPLGMYYFNSNGVELSNLSLSLAETEQIKEMYAESLKRVPDEKSLDPARFLFLLACYSEGELSALEGAVVAYLSAVPAEAPVSLVVLAGPGVGVEAIEKSLLLSCEKAGVAMDEPFADIEVILEEE